MSKPSTQRPPQVTMAGWVAMVGSVLVVLTVLDTVSNLRSLETRESIELWLDGPFNWLGLDMEGAIRLYRVGAVVAGTCAAATAILGWYVMRRDKGARLALAVLVVPMFLAGLFVGGFASSFVAAAAAMLWISPAREWFATGQWTPPPSPQARAAAQARRPAWPPVGPGTGGAPPSGPPSARPSGPPSAPAQGRPQVPGPAGPPPAGSTVAPYGAPWQQHPHPWGSVTPERPGAILTAVVLTSVLSVLVGLLTVMAIVLVAMSPELVVQELERLQPGVVDDVSLADIRLSTYVSGAVALVLCVLALTFAGFLTVGREWARRGLMVTAAFCAGAALLASATNPLSLVPAVAAVVTVVLLNRPESRAWCRSGGTTRRT